MGETTNAPDGNAVCPDCWGKKQKWLHLYGGPRSGWQWVKCDYCDGLGWVSLTRLEWWTAGEAMREDRKRRGLTLREEAERLGVTARELSDREWGRAGA